MPVRKGQCQNFGLCGTADQRIELTFASGEDFVCPECGRSLELRHAPASKFGWRALSAAVALLVVAFAVHSMMKIRSGRSTVHASTDRGSVILVLSGANRFGTAIAPALAEEFLQRLGARDVNTVPGEKDAEVRVQGILPGESSPKSIVIRAHGSDSAIQDLATGACDIAMLSRDVQAKESARLAGFGLGNMASPASQHAVGLDGIAVIVSRKNPVRSLTMKQVSLVFTGEIRDWAQAGGSSGPINVYVRDQKSGTYDTFKNLVLRNNALLASARRIDNNRDLSDKVAHDPNGIGVISMENIREAKAVAISQAGARAFLPDRLNISTGNYVLTRRLTLFTPAKPRNQLARKFVDFALSQQGQQIVAQYGFIGVNGAAKKAAPPPDTAIEQYRRLTQGANRLSIDIRFNPGTTELDYQSLVDLDRVLTFIADLHYSSDSIRLLAFADNTGSKQTNLALSQERAEAIALEFNRRGIKPASVVGFGSELPAGSGDSAEGGQSNRSIEIWVKK
jgi:phosphate transport system substrate-binding protein